LRILVTGGAGFIGSALCRRLIVGSAHEVVNLDKLTYAASLASVATIEADPRYSFVQADIADAAAVEAVFTRFKPEAVINLAAETHVDRSITGPGDFLNTNVVGAYVLLQAALKHWSGLTGGAREAFRFLHVSTDEVYGSLGETGLFTEETAYSPRSPYSATKAAADHLTMAWGETYGLPVMVSNCSNNYGAFQFPEKLIPLMIINGLTGLPLPVYGDGGNVRDWLHVDDHAAALQLVLEQGLPGESYNIGGGAERTNMQVVDAVCAALDRLAPDAGIGPRRGLIKFVTDRPGHDRRYAIDSSKIERELGWRAGETFESGLEATVAWYIEHRDWWEPLRARYGGQRLGLPASAVAAG